VNGANGKGFFETKFGKFRSADFGAASIDFVDGDENGFAAATKPGRGFAVERDDAFLNVDDEDDDVGGFDGEFDLFESGAGDDVVGFFAAKQAETAGVNESESEAMPFGFGGNAIASYTRAVMDDGDATSDNAVKKRRLSDVWATDYSNESWHAGKMVQKGRLRKEK
jgi:hypothetical protein